jgi:hypothetical protein
MRIRETKKTSEELSNAMTRKEENEAGIGECEYEKSTRRRRTWECEYGKPRKRRRNREMRVREEKKTRVGLANAIPRRGENEGGIGKCESEKRRKRRMSWGIRIREKKKTNED